MNNQQKSDDSKEKIASFSPVEEPVTELQPQKRKRGRPKSSPHDSATQNRIRVQRHREAKREDDEIRVDIYLPKAWHDWLINVKDANLREVATEAFSLWMEKNGFLADGKK